MAPVCPHAQGTGLGAEKQRVSQAHRLSQQPLKAPPGAHREADGLA